MGHRYCTAPTLKAFAEEKARIVREVDDVLVVNWVGPRKDNDYRKALHDLVSNAIQQHDDPQISESAAEQVKIRARLDWLINTINELVSDPLRDIFGMNDSTSDESQITMEWIDEQIKTEHEEL